MAVIKWAQSDAMYGEVICLKTAGSELRDRITEAAVRCFRRKGYEDVSVNDICQEADVARSTFYRIFSSKKDVIRYRFEHTEANQIVSIEELLAARNDFDRMWVIGDRYISLCIELGVGFCAAMMNLTLSGEIDLLQIGHSVDNWFIRLTRNCQQTGIIRSHEPPELLGPLFVDLVYQVLYDWCRHNGHFPVRARARQITEMIADLAPEYRWTEEQLKDADKK